MKQVWAIARLTFWEGMRMRIVLLLLVLLAIVVMRMPATVRGDDTLTGRLQTFLYYSLSALSVLTSLAVVFLSCATLTNEIRNRSIQMVVTKPVTRFQILAGKWIGINLLGLLVVAVAGASIYSFAWLLKQRPVQFERDRVALNDTVWTARVSASPTPPDFSGPAREYVKQLAAQGQQFINGEQAAANEYARELRERWLTIPKGEYRLYLFENLPPPTSDADVFQVRFKIRGIPAPAGEMLNIEWAILDPATGIVLQTMNTRERHEEAHQFLVRAAAIRDGKAAIGIRNPENQPATSALYLEGADGLRVLYRAGTFEGNFIKSLAMIVFRLAFLSALGLFFGTFVGFPVACFCVMTLYVLCLGAPWWFEVIGANMGGVVDPKVDPYGTWGPAVRALLVPLMQGLLPNFFEYDGVDALIDGTLIDLGRLLRSAAHTLVYGVLLLAVPGWWIFRSREVAQTVL